MQSEDLDILYLYQKVLFPYCSILIKSNLQNSHKLKVGDNLIAFPVRNIIDIIFYKKRIATIAQVVDIKHTEESCYKIKLNGISRVRLKKLNKLKHGSYELIEKDNGNPQRIRELRDELRKKSQELIFLINISESERLIYLLNFLTDLSQLTDFICNYFVLKFPKRFDIYTELKSEKRAMLLIPILSELIDKIKLRRLKETKVSKV